MDVLFLAVISLLTLVICGFSHSHPLTPNPLIAIRRLRGLKYQGVLLRMLQGLQFNVGIQLWPVKLCRSQTLNGVYLSNGCLSKNRIIVKRNKVFYIIHQQPKTGRVNIGHLTVRSGDTRQI